MYDIMLINSTLYRFFLLISHWNKRITLNINTMVSIFVRLYKYENSLIHKYLFFWLPCG